MSIEPSRANKSLSYKYVFHCVLQRKHNSAGEPSSSRVAKPFKFFILDLGYTAEGNIGVNVGGATRARAPPNIFDNITPVEGMI